MRPWGPNEKHNTSRHTEGIWKRQPMSPMLGRQLFWINAKTGVAGEQWNRTGEAASSPKGKLFLESTPGRPVIHGNSMWTAQGTSKGHMMKPDVLANPLGPLMACQQHPEVPMFLLETVIYVWGLLCHPFCLQSPVIRGMWKSLYKS